jgi:carboxylesterase type B
MSNTPPSSCAESASRPSRNDPKSPGNIGASENAQSEDCLTLNLWTKPQAGEKKKAVLAWIYGGGTRNQRCQTRLGRSLMAA